MKCEKNLDNVFNVNNVCDNVKLSELFIFNNNGDFNK